MRMFKRFAAALTAATLAAGLTATSTVAHEGYEDAHDEAAQTSYDNSIALNPDGTRLSEEDALTARARAKASHTPAQCRQFISDNPNLDWDPWNGCVNPHNHAPQADDGDDGDGGDGTDGDGGGDGGDGTDGDGGGDGGDATAAQPVCHWQDLSTAGVRDMVTGVVLLDGNGRQYCVERGADEDGRIGWGDAQDGRRMSLAFTPGAPPASS